MNEWSYSLSLFGEPSTTQPWGWQLFGQHLTLSCFVVRRQMVFTPAFLGAEPAYELEFPLDEVYMSSYTGPRRVEHVAA